jgi:long-chain fatty acid transport protein
MSINKSVARPSRLAAMMIVLLASLLAVDSAEATNGYFSHGYGLKYKALAGAGVALGLGPLASATNPASLAFLNNQYEISVALFNPNRQYTITGRPSGFPGTFGLRPGTYESDSRFFVIPSLAASWEMSESLRLGVAVYGNGGMNTNYPTNTFHGTSPTGVDLSQLFLAPTLAVKAGKKHGFGVTPIFSYQRFEGQGLQAFGNFSGKASALTNNKHDNSLGVGVRIGYGGEWLDFLAVGASYQSKMAMSEFEDYAGLFAEQGDFDIPANWTAGIALGRDKFKVVFDVQQIMYSDIKSVGNPMLPNLQQSRLGDANAAGFGWEDMTVFKAGVQFQIAGGWTWRAGYSFGEQPVPKKEVMFNILAPGVIEQHLTLGFSKALSKGKALDVAIMRAFPKTVSGANPLEAPNQQTIALKMDQWEFGVGFSF